VWTLAQELIESIFLMNATVEAPAESRLELACDVNAGCLPRLVGIVV